MLLKAALLLTTVLVTPVLAADPLIDEQIAFIESRLDAGQPYAELWQNGWTATYAGVALVQGTLAFTEDDSDDQVANGVGALRAISALALMRIRPMPGRHGAEPMRSAGPAGSLDRLEAGEALLAKTAHRAAERYSWRRHLINVGVNLVFGGMIWAFGDSDDVLPSVLLGIAGGEASILTSPRQPLKNKTDYQSRFGGRSHARLRWEVAPTARGIAVQARFR